MYTVSATCVSLWLQGLGTAVLAAILGSLPKTGGSLADHTVLLSGERCSVRLHQQALALAVMLPRNGCCLALQADIWGRLCIVVVLPQNQLANTVLLCCTCSAALQTCR